MPLVDYFFWMKSNCEKSYQKKLYENAFTVQKCHIKGTVAQKEAH